MTSVIKRNGSRAQLDLNQIQLSVDKACAGIQHVAPLMIVLDAQLTFKDGMHTRDIHKAIVESARNLITEETPEYALAAGRLLLQDVRKEVYGDYTPWSWRKQVEKMVAAGMYDRSFLNFTDEEFQQLDEAIDHDLDERMEYGGLAQTAAKYLMRKRVRKQTRLLESPQMMYMRVAVAPYADQDFYRGAERMEKIIDGYIQGANARHTKPTPIMGGGGSPTRQGSSCVGVKVGDDLDSIGEAGNAIMRYSGKRAGIGFDVSAVRPEGSSIRNGEMSSTGAIPFIKKLRGDLKSCAQGGIRGASATCYFPGWHMEFRNLIVLKNSKGTEETRERRIDYGIQLNGLLLHRIVTNQRIYLFDQSQHPEMYQSFFNDQEKFARLYESYIQTLENRFENGERLEVPEHLYVPAAEFGPAIFGERSDTGRIFPCFVDNMNDHGPFMGGPTIYHSNLCAEIALPSLEFKDKFDENGRVFLCTLACTNWGVLKSPKELEPVMNHLVDYLDTFIEYQDYPQYQAQLATEEFRPLGIGMIGLAHFFAKHHVKYGSPEALALMKTYAEHMYFYGLKASVELAKKRGPCKGWKSTIYGRGLFLWEVRKPGVDALTDMTPDPTLDWEGLRADMAVYGVRNATIIAQPPAETSSQPVSETNGVEAPMDYVTVKESKDGTMIHVVPELRELKPFYELKFNMGQDGTLRYLKTMAVYKAYTCQSISSNTFYRPSDFPKGRLPYNKLLSDVVEFYKAGGSTLYYHLNYDGRDSKAEAAEVCEGCTV